MQPHHRSYRTVDWNRNNDEVVTNADWSKPYLGIVRDSRDPQHMGRIKVWIPDLTGDSDLQENWLVCTYCSPFAGASYFDSGIHHDGRDTENPSDAIEFMEQTAGKEQQRVPERTDGTYSGRQSYGMWFVPPDIGNEVVVQFLNGNPNFAIWTGCLFQQHTNHMVPGIAENQIFNGETSNVSDEIGPVLDPDFSLETTDNVDDNPRKKAYVPLRDGLKIQQGLIGDKVRGSSTSSARRETPSQTFGILTPNGNQLVMDDKADSQFIRMRTKGGAQVLIHQTEGMVYIISRDGKSWMEWSNDGDIDVYAAKSVSVHAEKNDVNVKAGNNVNMEASRDINIRANRNVKIEAKGTFDISSSSIMRIEAGSDMNILSGSMTAITSGTNMDITSGTDMKIFGGPNVFLNEPKGIQASATIPITLADQPSGVTTQAGSSDGWVGGEPYTDNENIVPRVPQHEPWAEHKIEAPGFGGRIVEGSIDKSIKKGASTPIATKPNDIIEPDATHKIGESYDRNDEPVFTEAEPVPLALSNINERQISDDGLELIKKYEGSRNCVYKDVAGLDTIGVGHLVTDADRASGRFANGCISDEEIDQLLLEDLEDTQKAVRRCVKQDVTQEQYDALTSLAFNIGPGAFCGSTLVSQMNDGDYSDVPRQMLRWNKATVDGNLVEVRGLTNRRTAEANLFARSPTIPPTS